MKMGWQYFIQFIKTALALSYVQISILDIFIQIGPYLLDNAFFCCIFKPTIPENLIQKMYASLNVINQLGIFFYLTLVIGLLKEITADVNCK